MARKSKRDDLATKDASKSKPIVADPGRQPRIVGWLVLIVGGFSSWYWYRPLPDTVNQTVHATIASSWASSTSGPKSLWTDQTLILPSADGIEYPTHGFRAEVANHSGEDAQLVGTPNVTLVPWNEAHTDIREVLKTERVPMVPVAPNFNEFPRASASQVWTPDQQLSNRIGESSNSRSNWPDAGYVPPQKIQKEQRRTATKITTQIPKLLETGMKSIRIEESIESVAQTFPNQPARPVDALPEAVQPARQPQFIRQPRSSN